MNKQAELEFVQNQIKEIDITRSPLVELANRLHKEIRQEAMDAKYKDFVMSPENVMNLAADEYGSYKNLHREVDAYFSSFRCVGRSSGYYPATNQMCIHASMKQDVSLSVQILEIRQFIPFIKEREISFKDENNKVVEKKMKSIRIFEHTLSESAMYAVHFDADSNEMILVASSRSWSKVLLRVKNENEIMMWQYIQDNHPYEMLNKKREY